MTTCAVSPTVSLMQMNLSDSRVRFANPMDCTLTPLLWSCREREITAEMDKGLGGVVSHTFDRR